MTLNSSGLFSRYDGSRTGRTSTREPGKNARTLSISTVKPPLTRPVMMPMTISCFSNAVSRRVQVLRALGFLAGQAGFARTVLHAIQRDFDGLADGDLDFTLFVLELIGGNDRFGLQSDVDDDVVLAYFDDQSVEDGARTNALARDALFEQFRKTFCHVFS